MRGWPSASNTVGVVELQENTDAAAFSMAVAAGGAVKAFKTTPLLSVEEGVEALRKAQAAVIADPADSAPVDRPLSQPGHGYHTHAVQPQGVE